MKSKGRGLFFQTGYQEYAKLSMRMITVFNSLLAIWLLLLGSPFLILLALLLKITDGRPIFYRGIRLGIHKKQFVMYKFRTLPKDAQKTIGTELLSDKHHMVTPLTRFLRDTRLDEIPQLFNIIKGDMDFIGPRPERPEIYESRCKSIPNYDKRFLVKPGLIGYAQLFTPHSTPKIIRTHIDNRLMLKKKQFSWSIHLIFFTILIMHREIFRKGRVFLSTLINSRILKKYDEHRSSIRLQPDNITVKWRIAGDASLAYQEDIELFDINDSCFRLHSKEKLPKGTIEFKLAKQISKNGRSVTKKAICKGEIVIERTRDDCDKPHISIVHFSAVSNLNQYMIDKYFTEKSMA